MMGSEVAYGIARLLGPALGVKVRTRMPYGQKRPSVESQVASIGMVFPGNVKRISSSDLVN